MIAIISLYFHIIFFPFYFSSSGLFSLFLLSSYPTLLMSSESQYMAKQMLAGNKGTKSFGRPSAGKLLAPRRLLCVPGIALFQWCAPEMEDYILWLSTYRLNWQARYLHNIFSLNLPSPSPSHRMFLVLNTGLESLRVSN